MIDPTAPLSRNRDFRLLWLGQAASMLGSRISWVAYPLLVLALTNSPTKAGVVGFASTIPALLFGLPAGALVDRWNRRRTMIACDLGRAVAVGSIVVATAAGVLTYYQLVAVAFVERSLSALFDPAEEAAIGQIVPTDQLPLAIARNESREYAAFLVGPPLGGALFQIGRGLPFLADAVSYVVSAISLGFIRRPLNEAALARDHLLRSILDGASYLARTSFLRTTTLISAGSNFVSNGIGLATVVIARQAGATAAEIGVMLAIAGLGGLFGSLAAPRLQSRLSPNLVVGVGTWTWTALVALVAIAHSVWALAAILATLLFLAPLWNATIQARRIALTPDRLRGRVNSAGGMLSVGFIAFGTLAAGVLLEHVGAAATALSFAACMGAVAALTTLTPSVRAALSGDYR